ncbi:hypothetical protein BpHYR1_018472 [Brachionus plicatilis]|uniref:Uncharacterized protein n=1 Tax=Brachionus plicatilis TaxID=10195 RepID=A0A3M7Q3B3_BRAPC|nr:hypothetical protein BpHYR1_018472 [Brachionus plicatilis]
MPDRIRNSNYSTDMNFCFYVILPENTKKMVHNKERCLGRCLGVVLSLNGRSKSQIFSYPSYFEVLGILTGYLAAYLDGRLAFPRVELWFHQQICSFRRQTERKK